MHAVTRCPEENVLRRFMLGEITGQEAESLELHLDTCEACCGRVATLSAEDGLVAAMRERSPIASETDHPLVHDLVDRVRGLRSASPSPQGDMVALSVKEGDVRD